MTSTSYFPSPSLPTCHIVNANVQLQSPSDGLIWTTQNPPGQCLLSSLKKIIFVAQQSLCTYVTQGLLYKLQISLSRHTNGLLGAMRPLMGVAISVVTQGFVYKLQIGQSCHPN